MSDHLAGVRGDKTKEVEAAVEANAGAGEKTRS